MAPIKSFQFGCHIQQGYYKSFQPNQIDRDIWQLLSSQPTTFVGGSGAFACAHSRLTPRAIAAPRGNHERFVLEPNSIFEVS